jgi:class 3 adenylate cyclase/tetratricopeptide (TPR) repeat protein
MRDKDIEDLRAAIAALEGQRATLGDAVLDLATAPLRQRLASQQRPAGLQHRQVTVLFADVVGSTRMASGLEAEDTLELLSGTLSRMATLIEAHQGRVLRFTGDGVKAAFGTDEAREDDAERAVRAGLAIVRAGREQALAALQAHGIADFAVRVGVHTGDVALGAGVEADNTAMGAAVNIAARMEQSAPPGALRISHDTWNHVRGLFDVDEQPPLQVKGVDAPMQTYLVRAALDRRVAGVERGLQGLTTPMMGRQDELQRLLRAVARARETGQLQALTLLGDAGLGKSRLLRELVAALAHDAPRVLAVRSQPDGMLRPWGLLRSLLATQFGVADTDSVDAARHKVVDGLAAWLGEQGERQAHLIGQLSGLDFGDSPHVRGLDPRSLRDQAFAAFRAYLQALAARGETPLMLVEDLHWADDGSLDLLTHLREHGAELPLALVMTARPALLTRRPDWGLDGSIVPLTPLAAAHSDQLLQALLQRLDGVPAKLTELIVGQAEGNPYYMEELVRRLIDVGVIAVDGPRWTLREARLQNLRLPGTLVGLLQARLDALPSGERLAARQASVIGHVFWDDALQALNAQAPQALPGLQREGFVRAHETSDFEGTTERRFDHHLLHQVTYDTLLKAERRLGHGAAARWLIERTKGRGAEFMAMTGEHAERAGDTALAIDCFEQAGREAQKRFANTAAESWLHRALGLLGESDPGRRFDLLGELQAIADTVGNRSAQDALHADMAAVLGQHPDDIRQARLAYSMGMLADRRGDRELAEHHARQACELAERCGAAETAALSHGLRVWLCIARHELEAAREHVEPGLRWATRITSASERAPTEARLLTLSAMVSTRLSRYDEAHATLLDVLARGEALDSPRVQFGALDNLAVVDAQRSRWDAVAQWGERMLALAQASGNLPYVVKAQWRLARAAAGRKDDTAALYWCERNLPLARAVGDRHLEAAILGQLANSRRGQGDVAAALEWKLQAQAVCRAINDPARASECAASAALCEVDLGRPDAALSRINGVLDALDGELSRIAGPQTIGARWTCVHVLEKLRDARAPMVLERLHADVQSDIAALADPADRKRLIQEHEFYGDIVAAYQRMRKAHSGAS